MLNKELLLMSGSTKVGDVTIITVSLSFVQAG